MSEDEMIEEAMLRALLKPVYHILDFDVDYYLMEVREEESQRALMGESE